MTQSALSHSAPPSDLTDFAGVPRDELEARVVSLCRENAELRATLRAAQEAGTRLYHRLVALGQAFPHWECPACRAFNGEAKERLTRCRACGAARP